MPMGIRGCTVLALASLSVQATLPCGGVYRKGQEAAITSESALIVWEQESQTETFIRRANFLGKGGDFGFIVPTPSEPELSEVGDALFPALTRVISSRYRGGSASLPSAGPGGMSGGGGGGHVEVIKEQMVSGMKATVLKATDTRSLQAWLSSNGYPANPQVMRWTENYVKSDFYLTAFKIDRKPESQAVKTSAVKMVFRTKVPFYPYREPEGGPRHKGRSLAVFFIGPWKVNPRYMNSNRSWEATRRDVDDLTTDEAAGIQKLAAIPPEHFPANPYFTSFLDRNEVRPDYDLVFVRH